MWTTQMGALDGVSENTSLVAVGHYVIRLARVRAGLMMMSRPAFVAHTEQSTKLRADQDSGAGHAWAESSLVPDRSVTGRR
jgi:hypothetical protein